MILLVDTAPDVMMWGTVKRRLWMARGMINRTLGHRRDGELTVRMIPRWSQESLKWLLQDENDTYTEVVYWLGLKQWLVNEVGRKARKIQGWAWWFRLEKGQLECICLRNRQEATEELNTQVDSHTAPTILVVLVKESTISYPWGWVYVTHR